MTAPVASPGARPDPVAGAIPGQEFVYAAVQSLWSAWARRRYRDAFDRVTAFCLFVGYPRSGHSIVGAMLNAHRHCVISHELDVLRLVSSGAARDVVYSRILGRAAWFNLRGNRSNYAYQVPDSWQGRFEDLQVVGDKGGGWAAQWIGANPRLLDTLRATVGVPLRLIHVVRNPFDNIAAIALWHRLTLDESIDFYFSHCDTTRTLHATADGDEVLTVHHETFVRAPEPTLRSVCDFLGLAVDARYLDACASVVFGRPTNTRLKVPWTDAQRAEVDRRRARIPFLADYSFAIDTASEAAAAVTQRGSGQGGVARMPSMANRIAAFVSPRTPASATRSSIPTRNDEGAGRDD